MSRHSVSAVLASAAVIATAVGFYGYASATRSQAPSGGYTLEASFMSSNGLQEGADVSLAGVAVGRVASVQLDTKTMMSLVRFSVRQDLHLPVDTRVSIGSNTLTSPDELMIAPGHADQMLTPGSRITDTCDATSLEDAVSQYIFGSGGAPSGCTG